MDQHPGTCSDGPEHHLLREVQLAADQHVTHAGPGQSGGDGVALRIGADELPATGYRQVQAVEEVRVGRTQRCEVVEVGFLIGREARFTKVVGVIGGLLGAVTSISEY